MTLRNPASRLFYHFWMRGKVRPLLLSLIVVFIVLEIVAFSPSSVEEVNSSGPSAVEPEVFIPGQSKSLATGIPQNKVPDYSIDQFNYVSTQGGAKQWKLVAEKALLFNHEKIVHALKIKAFLYDPEGKITVVTGKEAKYFMNGRDLEIFGNVKAVFPDGFELDSPYLRHRPSEQKIEIPVEHEVHGHKADEFQSVSQGLDYAMSKGVITLPSQVRFTGYSSSGEKTVSTADRCVIEKDQGVAHLTMYPSRPVEKRFVEISQPALYSRCRRADLFYGTNSKSLNYLIAYEDVLVKELGHGASLKYATGGRAEFDARKNQIVMTEFPQVYQDNDTVTGERIILHRDTDVVEVEQSNAYSQGGKRQ